MRQVGLNSDDNVRRVSCFYFLANAAQGDRRVRLTSWRMPY